MKRHNFRPTGVRLLVHTVFRAWDFWISLAFGVATLLVLLIWSGPLADPRTFGAFVLATGAAIGIGSHVALRWLLDRLDGSPYGELVRATDRLGDSVRAPFDVVSAAAFLLAIVGGLGLLLAPLLTHLLGAMYYGVLTTLAAYVLLGSLSLIGIGAFHQRRLMEARSIMDELEREARDP